MRVFKLCGLFIMAVFMCIMNFSCSEDEELSSISFVEGTSLKMIIGTTETLHIIGEPSSLEVPACEWTSSNSDVVTVSSNGQLSAVNVGNATITAKTPSGLLASCSVTVEPINVTGIQLSDESKTLVIGETYTITAKVLPNDATYPSLIWSSSNNSIASVENGKITAIGVGLCQIIVEDEKKCSKSTCQVTVESVDVDSISLDIYEKTLYIGESFSIIAKIMPENASFKGLVWSTSNTNIATVENGVVKAVGVGFCQVIIEDEKKNCKSVCDVTVKPIEVEKIELSDKNVELYVSDSYSLHATVFPENATDKSIIWESSDKKIATVDKGKITAVSIGECVITASDTNKKVVATYNVSVVPIKVTGIETLVSNCTKIVGSKTILDSKFYKVLPINATDKNVSFKSSNPTIASVDNTGCVTALSIGQAIITIETEDGHFISRINFNITDDPSIFIESMTATKGRTSLSQL